MTDEGNRVNVKGFKLSSIIASLYLYKANRVCPSVSPSVGGFVRPSVRSFVRSWITLSRKRGKIDNNTREQIVGLIGLVFIDMYRIHFT